MTVPSLQLGIVTATPALCEAALAAALPLASREIDVLLWENGNTEPVSLSIKARRTWVSTNQGVTKGLHGLYEMSDPDPDALLVYMHDDVTLLERGWDARVRARFEDPAVGLVGFGGACLLSADVRRGPFYSSMMDAERHGMRVAHDFECAVIDGFGFAVRRRFLDQIHGWSWWPFPHHGYDLGLSCMAKRHAWKVWACPVACDHVGARTAAQAVYQDGIAKAYGGDMKLLRAAYTQVRAEFRHELPLTCPAPV